jgi:hypothetical protein
LVERLWQSSSRKPTLFEGFAAATLKCFNPGTKTEAGASSSSGTILDFTALDPATGRTKTEAGRI